MVSSSWRPLGHPYKVKEAPLERSGDAGPDLCKYGVYIYI